MTGEECRASMPSSGTCPPGNSHVHQPRSSPNPIVQGLSWWLHHIGMINYGEGLNLQSLSPPPEDGGLGWKFQVSNHSLVFTVTNPFPEPIQEPSKSVLIKTKNALVTQQIPRALGALCQELRSKTNIRTKDILSTLWKVLWTRILGTLARNWRQMSKYIFIILQYHTHFELIFCLE